MSEKVFTLAVPGGLAGQLFALGYAAWISSKRQEPVHIRFFDGGTSISKLGIESVLNSEMCQLLGVTYSVEKKNWPPVSSLMTRSRALLDNIETKSLFEGINSIFLGGYLASREKLEGGEFSWSAATSTSISLEKLHRSPTGSTISGFPTDYRVIEESWSLLATMIKTSGSPDFAHETGTEDSVAVHWRLGDYVGNTFHGAVSWGSLRNCLKYANPLSRPVKIFTDSPELARRTILEAQDGTSFEVVSGDVWSDLVGMTRSRIFIGSQSGVSFLAAAALRFDNPNSETWLPDKWFLNRKADLLFHQGPKTAEGSVFYPARLVTSLVPQ